MLAQALSSPLHPSTLSIQWATVSRDVALLRDRHFVTERSVLPSMALAKQVSAPVPGQQRVIDANDPLRVHSRLY
jgi:hypothetical protein